jgi:hypothetical protein
MKITRLIVILGAFALSTPAGINWRTVWLEPNPVNLRPGSSLDYVVRGIHGGSDEHVDLTYNPYLKITSSDESIVAVDRAGGRLLGNTVGRVEIRVSFSECTSLITATVRERSQGSQ